jgi:osmotically-inducible protein OsmY
VVAVANDIEIRLPGVDERPDPEIARDAIQRIKSELPFAWDRTRVVVKSGWVTLEGEVEWNYQRERAEAAVRRVRGLKGVTNSIEVKPQVAPSEIRRKIEDALRRAAEIDASPFISPYHCMTRRFCEALCQGCGGHTRPWRLEARDSLVLFRAALAAKN